MELKEKIALLEEMLEMDEGSLTPEDKLEDIDEWDSLAFISLVALIDEKFNRNVTGQVIRGFKTVQNILDEME
ncbi:acyl carrier protein [Paenibacillus sp. PL91]|uniref:acyl carrier protein n=1 Tax=Paenibacillus sp. PL91 TaxID=2729538 RepID=UPI00145DDDC7|nr:acyl carrier protein [Paenibacillus sp. PL91]MBC9202865.1 acyl carrier protein [Paenibacillus sp. PL91]